MKPIKFTGVFMFFMITPLLHAEWNPELVFFENKKVLQVLHHANVTTVEEQIFKHVKNTWCSQEKAQLLFELVLLTHPTVCVEIGAFTGSSTLPILAGLQYLKKGKAYVIEAWSNEEATKGLPANDPNTLWWKKLDMKEIKNQFMQMVDSWSLSAFCNPLQMTSKNAVSQIPSIDFLHLDGNPSEEGALLDSQLYVPKVVSGGYILLSNVLVMIDGKPAKMKALWPLFDQCTIVCELENGNALLFKKK